MSLRVTHRGLYTSSLAGLQKNLSRIQQSQQQLSSGKLLSVPSDSPAGTGAALRHRAEIARGDQLRRNADDGLGWLSTADTALTDALGIMGRVRELVIQGNNTVTGDDGRAAIASEIEGLRETLLNTANTRYLDRPIFAGTADVAFAYDAAGTFQGDVGTVSRSVRPGVAVRVNVTGEEAFGPSGNDVFAFLDDIVDHLRNDPAQLDTDLTPLDGHLATMKNALSTVGTRYNQVDTLRDKTDQDVILAKQQLSEVEDVDLPAAIVELQLRETAYQAALAATARAVQPSLLDFLR